MSSSNLKLFLSLFLISFITSIPSFKISVLNKDGTECIYLNNGKEPSFRFSLVGTPTDLKEAVTFAFYLETPTYGVARCTAFPPERSGEDSYLDCLVDGFYYEIGKDEPITLPDTLPEFNTIKIKGWDKFIDKNGKIISGNANCNDSEFKKAVVLEPPIGGSVDNFGCFGLLNLFRFKAHLTKGELEEEKDDLLFNLNIKLYRDNKDPKSDVAYCTVPTNVKSEDDLYQVYCYYRGKEGKIEVSGYTEAKTSGNGSNSGKLVYVLGEFLPLIEVETCVDK